LGYFFPRGKSYALILTGLGQILGDFFIIGQFFAYWAIVYFGQFF
jgi:hypothetical protein